MLNRIYRPGGLCARSVMLGAAALFVSVSATAFLHVKASAQDGAKTGQAAQNQVRPTHRPVNVKPLSDMLSKVKQLKDAGQLDLASKLTLVVEADRRDDGTLENAQLSKVSGNATVDELAGEFLQALSASRVLGFLEHVSHMKLALRLNEQNLSFDLSSEVESAERASQMAIGYGELLRRSRITKKGKDEAEIWQSMSVAAQGKQFTIAFLMSREAFAKLITKSLVIR